MTQAMLNYTNKMIYVKFQHSSLPPVRRHLILVVKPHMKHFWPLSKRIN